MRIKPFIPVVAVALTCLLGAGCSPETEPGKPAGLLPSQTFEEAWQDGFDDAMNGLPSAGVGAGPITQEYQTGYQAGARFKADFHADPRLLPPQNPYASPPLPAGNQPPSASGGG